MVHTVFENKNLSLRDLQAAVARKESEDQRCNVLGKSVDASALNALKADLVQRLETKAAEEARCKEILANVRRACETLVAAGEAIIALEGQHNQAVNAAEEIPWGVPNLEPVRGLARSAAAWLDGNGGAACQ